VIPTTNAGARSSSVVTRITVGRGRPTGAGKDACSTSRERSAGIPACSRRASLPGGVRMQKTHFVQAKRPLSYPAAPSTNDANNSSSTVTVIAT
jgi:hypothetical protein